MVLSTKTYKSAFSIVEMLVSLAIIGLLIILFSNLMVGTLMTSIKISSRSSLREELASISGLIKRDLRSAEQIVACGVQDTGGTANSCTLIVGSATVTWKPCNGQPTQFCKYNQSNQELFHSSSKFKLESISFDPAFSSGIDLSQRSILITLIVSHTNARLGITNLVFQSTVATRNYDFNFALP